MAGAQGRQSSPISLAVVTSVVSVLMVIFFGLAVAGSYALTIHSVGVQRQQERAQGIQELRAICHTLDSLASLKPPAGDAKQHASRAYEQRFHDTIIQLRPDLGCQRLP